MYCSRSRSHSRDGRVPGWINGVKDRFLGVPKYRWGSITPCTYFLFHSESTEEQQENITSVMNSGCNSVALPLSRNTPKAHAQSLGSSPLHTTEKIKNIQILSRTEKNKQTIVLGSSTSTPGTLHCLPACLGCSEVWKKTLWHIFMS